jgi:hypothetical protein
LFIDHENDVALKTTGAIPTSVNDIACVVPPWGAAYPSANTTLFLNQTDQVRNAKLQGSTPQCVGCSIIWSAGTDIDVWSDLEVKNRPLHVTGMKYFFEVTFKIATIQNPSSGPASGGAEFIFEGAGFDKKSIYYLVFQDTYLNRLRGSVEVLSVNRIKATSPDWGTHFVVSPYPTTMSLHVGMNGRELLFIGASSSLNFKVCSRIPDYLAERNI